MSYARNIAAVGTGAAGVAAGMALCTGLWVIPALHKTKDLNAHTKARFFIPFYEAGKSSQAPLSLLATGAFLRASYKAHEAQAGHTALLLAGAAASVFAMLPWTLLAMMGTNNRIFALAAADDKTQAPEIESLFAKWQTLHAVRSGLVTLGFGLGLYTLI